MKLDFFPFLRYVSKTTYFINEMVTARDCRIIYVLSGKGVFESDEIKIELCPNTLVYYSYNQPYKIEGNKENKLLFYTLNFDFTQEYTNVKTMKPLPINKVKNDCNLKTIPPELNNVFFKIADLKCAFWAKNDIERIYQEYIDQNDWSNSVCNAQLKILLIDIYRQVLKSKSQNSLCEKIKNTVCQNPHLNIKEIASLLNYHPFYLNEIFKKYEDTTLHNYIVQQRLIKANELICTTKLELSEIALICGFSSQAHLTSSFKKAYNITPGFSRHQM